MCRRLLLAAACLAFVGRPLAAQRTSGPDARTATLLVRAESLSRDLKEKDRLRRAATESGRRGQVLQAGRVVAVFWESVSPETGQRLVERVDSIIEAFGGGPAELLDHVVAVQWHTADSARLLAQAALARRSPVEMDWGGDEVRHPEVGAWELVGQIGRRYRRTLDSAWQRWLPQDYGILWERNWSDAWALATLTEPETTTGTGCLAGRLHECRLWLGLDDIARPIATRYRASDLRLPITRWRNWGGDPDRQTCLNGDDAACVRFAEAHRLVPSIPSPDYARESFVRAVWALHGPVALARAFTDRQGSVGERFARAVSIREDSLVAEWRTWTLGRGRTDHLAASLPQALIVLLAATLLVGAAARSGRWR